MMTNKQQQWQQQDKSAYKWVEEEMARGGDAERETN
jgi:hypothetical protein